MRIQSLALVLLLGVTLSAQTRDFTRWVDPFIGTGGHGHTFPGATVPFGMVQLSPDTRTDNWDGSSGYHYSDDIIYGFSHTHLSGTGIPDYCDILLMPASLNLIGGARSGDSSTNGYASKFSHGSEKAEPGYYGVTLLEDGIEVELAATPRVGLHRYTFSKAGKYRIVVDLKWRDKVLASQLRIVNDHRIEGYRASSSWAKNQKIFFVVEFSKPFADLSSQQPFDGSNLSGTNVVLDLNFGVKAQEKVLVKVALSPVSIEGARKNLAAELPGWDFDKVRADAKAAWNKELSKIEVSGGTDAQTKTFYTALYHTMIQPNIFNDVDGNYRGHDGKIHNINNDGVGGALPKPELQKPARSKGIRPGDDPKSKKLRNPPANAGGSAYYTVFSLWDTFRAAHPLYTIIEQKRTVDFINTFIRIYEQGGRLPVWDLWGQETDTMIGYHAVSVIADAMAKGIKGFDYEKAYAAAKNSAELDHFGLAAYKKRGYISMEDDDASVSKTLEYAYDDWCIAQMAEILLKTAIDRRNRMDPALLNLVELRPLDKDIEEYEKYLRRARNFENLFDSRTGFMRPKKNGGFVTPFAPNEVTFNYTEGNAWVYSFFVPQDINRLMELQGGREKFVAKLDGLFTTTDKLAGREQPDITGLIGQYAHGNEPSHHIAYLYDYAGQPWKTQKYVRQIMDEFYRPSPEGLIGNEDCGQMSAWYVLSASGFYEVTPGSAIYAFGTPLFKKIKYHLENGKTLIISAPNVSATNIHIRSARLNGQPYRKAFILHDDLMKGGVLEFEMGDDISTQTFSFYPEAKIEIKTVPVPSIRFGETTDEGKEVYFDRVDPMNGIRYTTDGSDPTSSETSEINLGLPTLRSSAIVKAVAYDPDRKMHSMVAEATYRTKPNNWAVSIASKYNRQYTGGGDEGLIDGIRGNVNFSSGEWQGYQGQDFVATVDLQKETQILTLGAGFLQNARSWIWMPTHIEFETSQDGVNFTKVADIKTDVAQDDMEPRIRDYTTPIKPVTARYVRIHAYNFGKIPSWHPGAGGDPWIFVDEIIIR